MPSNSPATLRSTRLLCGLLFRISNFTAFAGTAASCASESTLRSDRFVTHRSGDRGNQYTGRKVQNDTLPNSAEATAKKVGIDQNVAQQSESFRQAGAWK